MVFKLSKINIQQYYPDSQESATPRPRENNTPVYASSNHGQYKDYQKSHLEEFLASGISETTIALNYESFDDEYEPIARLTYALNRSDYLNNGRLKSCYYRPLKHLMYGSWGFLGVDVLTGEEDLFGSIKPNVPKEHTECLKGGKKKIKSIKYEPPRKTKNKKYASVEVNGLFALKNSLEQWAKVSQRYGVPMPENIVVEDGWARGFYQWLKDNASIPLGITEGAKKTSCVIEDGYIMVGVPGITMGYRQPKDEWGNKDGDRFLIPELAYFAQAGREIYFAFDNDEKESTRKNVDLAMSRTAELLEKEGCHVSVVTWEEEKGLDDLIVAHGFDSFAEAYKNRTPISKYRFDKYLASENKIYEKNKLFTSNNEINQQYLDVDLSGSDKIYLIKSGLGSGKTHKVIKQIISEEEKGIIYANYRNTLCLQFNERAGKLSFYHYQSEKNLEKFSLYRQDLKVSLCIDSLGNFNPTQFDGKIIILDEIVSVIKHLLFSPTIKKFEKIRHLFTEMIRRCDRIIGLDANLQNWVVDFIAALCPEKEMVTIGNVYKAKKADVIMLDGVIKNEKLRKNSRSPHVKAALESNCPVVCADSQLFCESIENIFIGQGRKGIRIDSTTTSTDKVKAFLRNPKKWIEENHPSYVIYSPSAESGLDIDIHGYFTDIFGFFFGALDIDSILQMLGRLRDQSVTRHVWCKEYIFQSGNEARPSNLNAVRGQRYSWVMQELGELVSSSSLTDRDIVARLLDIYQNDFDPFSQAADTIKAIQNHEFKNYRTCLSQALISTGHNVTFYRPNHDNDFTTVSKTESMAKKSVKQQNSAQIFNASDEYVGKTNIRIAFDAPQSERWAVKKAKIISLLPGIKNNPIWSPEFIETITYSNPRLIKQTEQNYLLHNLEMARKLSINKYNQIHNDLNFPVWKFRSDLPRLVSIRDTGLLDLINSRLENPDLVIDLKSAEFQRIITNCQEPRHKKVLGSTGKHPMKFFIRVLRNHGYKIKSRKVKRGKDTVREYYLDIDYLVTPERVAIFEAIKLKYEQIINSKTHSLKWSNPLVDVGQKLVRQETEVEVTESVATKTQTEVAHQGVFVNNSSAMCHQENGSNKQVNNQVEKQHSTIVHNPLDSEVAIADLASILMGIESAQELAELSKQDEAFNRSRLNRAVRKLSKEWQQKIRRWVAENNNNWQLLK